MRYTLSCCLLLLVFLTIGCASEVKAQEESNVVAINGTKYIGFKIKKLEEYNSRLASRQKHLLNKLKKKEKRFASKLKKHDSLAYSKYMQQSLSYDSINTLSKADTGKNLANAAKKKNAAIDSLKKIQGFVDSKSGLPSNTTSGKSAELDRLQDQLNYRNNINDLIAKRTSFLKGLAANGKQLSGFSGIEKQVFYSKAKMKVFKDIEEEPSVAEDKALEYLQGTDGFDKYMSRAGAGANGMHAMGGADAGQLEKMGYQTKQQMQKNLEGKFGGNLGSVSKQMGGSLKQWQDEQSKLGEIKKTKQSLKQAKQSLHQVKNIEKPSFKVNPMRGMPFMKRIERQYNWQTTRANAEQPAILEASAMVGFKHTSKLTYGLGIAYAEGLGESWQKIRFSFQGVGYRTFAKWEWQYGIGAYAGYERMYKPSAFSKPKQPSTDGIPTAHNTQNYTESILIGLTKSYNLNAKYNGAIQVLYDIWWQQKGLRNPITLRFVTVKK